MSVAYSIIIALLYFFMRLELDPKLGNIWIRPNEKNILVFCPGSIIELLKAPFKNIFFWYPNTWCLNIYVVVTVFIMFFYIIFN